MTREEMHNLVLDFLDDLPLLGQRDAIKRIAVHDAEQRTKIDQQAKEIADLKDRLRKLDALEHAGVDNWEWYDNAMQSIAEEEA